ncbi:MAG: hypothetical protein U5L96_10630 [Owenweeksia sp.]|nr:hypothetical protein [Owenweeksia sp.]
MTKAIPTLLLALLFGASQAQQTISINPTKDNTLYESTTGNISNGAGDFYLFWKDQ